MRPIEHWGKEPADFPAEILANYMVYRHATQFMFDHVFRQTLIRRQSAAWPAVAVLLREHIDQWIQSGYDAEDRETPWARHLSGALLKKLKSFHAQNPLQVRVQEWGEVLCAIPAEPSASGDFAAHEAMRLMFTLLDSEFKYTIAKCLKRGCGTYFKRSKLQECFKRGAYCAKHSKGAGTDIQRKKDKAALLRLAAKFWSQWTPDAHPNQALWVAAKIKEVRRSLPRVTQKWVSRNAVEIKRRSSYA